MIRKFVEVGARGEEQVVLWGLRRTIESFRAAHASAAA